jgi:hypothetical protein
MPVEQDVAPEKPSRIARPGPVDPLADPLRDPIADALRAGSRIPALPVHHRRAAEPPAPPPSEAGDDALADEVLAAASAEAAAPVEQDQEEDDAPPVETWEDYTVDQAHADEDQRFGVEVELKTTEIPYDDTVNELGKKVRGPFHQFAIERGHKAVYKHKRVGIEVHLDQGEADGALLEMVTQAQAGDVLAATLSTLRSELTALKTAADFAKWLAESCTPAATTTAEIDQYIRTKLKVSNGQLFPNMVQMTTTLTATQIANMGGDFPQFMVGDAPGGGMSGSKLTRQMFEDAAKRGKSADAVVQGYLANLPAYAKSKGGKGTNAPGETRPRAVRRARPGGARRRHPDVQAPAGRKDPARPGPHPRQQARAGVQAPLRGHRLRGRAARPGRVHHPDRAVAELRRRRRRAHAGLPARHHRRTRGVARRVPGWSPAPTRPPSQAPGMEGRLPPSVR